MHVIETSAKGGYRDSNPGPPEPQSGALTNCAIPTILRIWASSQLKMCPKGFEPPTHGLEGRCSIQLSYGHICDIFAISKRVMGIEPTYLAWKASVLPLNYTRKYMLSSQPFKMASCEMPRAGIEPATRGFSVLCSTNWAIWASNVNPCVTTWIILHGIKLTVNTYLEKFIRSLRVARKSIGRKSNPGTTLIVPGILV